MQKETLDKIVRLDNQQQELLDSLKLDCKAMCVYVTKMIAPVRKSSVVASG